MDDETPEMEEITVQMRAAMAAWVKDPENAVLRGQFRDLQARYQRLFQAHKRRQLGGNGVAA